MDHERFTALAQAYGARIGRWPEAERAAAETWVQTNGHAAAVLQHADALDALLDEWRIEAPEAALRLSVLASATSRRRFKTASVRTLWTRDVFARDLRLWFAGAGLAAGLAGVFCGAVLSTVAVGEARDEALVASAVSDTAVSTPAQT
jgi:hypothetical protein